MAGSQLVSYPRTSTSYANYMAEQLNTSSNSAFAVVPPNDDPQSTEPVAIDKIIGDELFQESSDKTDTDNVGYESGFSGLMEDDARSHGQTPTEGNATKSATHIWSR